VNSGTRLGGSETRLAVRPRKAPELGPARAEARSDLAQRLLALGRTEESLRLLREELLVFGSDGLSWFQALISDRLGAGDLTQAGAYAALLAELRWGSAWYPSRRDTASIVAPVQTPTRRLTAFKLEHDREQFAYLRRRGVLGPEFIAIEEKYRHIASQLKATGGDTGVTLNAVDHPDINPVYNRIVHIRTSPRVSRALCGQWNASSLEDEYLSSPPGIVVVDDFLSHECLRELQLFCLESTVWLTNRYARGRLGAFFQDGFNCPLLLQIAQELRAALPRVIGDRYPLRQMWAFKHTQEGSAQGNTHADFAAVNVNFWITPTQANLDPGSGGLLIYNLCAPRHWTFDVYNRRADLIARYLRERNVRPLRIPYRENRAVIFNADLFHGTDALRFRTDYESQRVNVTMLYGNRENDSHHPPVPVKEPIESAPFRRSALRSQVFSRSRRG
jgi:hypothetical protein